ncbi:hypothetical protein [Pirellula sp. SH-Sr6A]|uniref:hypothetical protein n=1 Tax=Pirellula sp. SH-Sr6A TaxID=1632865 RepID=UPI0011BAD807|nr:hypothetical protein [Pirellula sp. SH-Sr6A]
MHPRSRNTIAGVAWCWSRQDGSNQVSEWEYVRDSFDEVMSTTWEYTLAKVIPLPDRAIRTIR